MVVEDKGREPGGWDPLGEEAGGRDERQTDGDALTQEGREAWTSFCSVVSLKRF